MNKSTIAPAAIVIFGGTGDLTRRKLIPALYNLYLTRDLPERFRIILVGRNPDVNEQFKKELLSGVQEFSRTGNPDRNIWKSFSDHMVYQQGNFLAKETYEALKAEIAHFDKGSKKKCNRIYYFAIAPQFIETVSQGLYDHNMCNRVNNDRIVIEKPFGTDLASAKKLNRLLQMHFAEKQIFRIDHYLGKETVQNIMAFRFANSVFEPLWNNRYIDHIQISVAEQVSVGKRGAYYDTSGALRDMIQNHLMQLLCVTAMDCPGKYEAEDIRNAKVKALRDMRIYNSRSVSANIIRGQYTKGEINGKAQMDYREEENVAPKSNTETFVAARFFIDNKRWKGVPFFLRTGKCMPFQSSVIVIQFKDSQYKVFNDDVVPNRLIITIQPEQEISLLFESKVPGVQMKLKAVEMDFTYKESHSEASPEAYETLLLDILEGDATLFMRNDQVEAAWKVVMPILNAWKKQGGKGLRTYAAGTWGPAAAKSMLKPYAKDWTLLPAHLDKKNKS